MRVTSMVLLLAVTGCGGPDADPDADGDGWPADLDCDDASAAVHPAAAEICNAVDDDCDGQVDVGAAEAVPWFADADADGAGDVRSFTIACDAPAGGVAEATDCDDLDPAVKPGAVEACNGRDDDCDGRVDEDAPALVPRYGDADGDGHGDVASVDAACVPSPSSVPVPDDCDDTDALVHPGAAETCDGVDQDCDELVDEDATDATPWSPDVDLDGFGWAAVVVPACAAPAGYVADGTDCDDFDGANHPGADERCDHIDNDCDALVDGPDAVDPTTWYRDLDGDGFGSISTSEACDAPIDHVALGGDCNDADDTVSPFADEICANGIDDDCNGLADECGGAVGGPTTVSVADAATASFTGGMPDEVEWVASAGDLDGDGLGELAIGGPFADFGGLNASGVVRLVYGSAAPSGNVAVTTLPAFHGTSLDDRVSEYGNLAGVGDLDGDGLDDLMLGAVNADHPSAATADVGLAAVRYGDVVRESGATSVHALDVEFSSDFPNAAIGFGVAGIGDLDGDGLADAAFAEVPNFDQDGQVRLLFGDATRPSGRILAASLPVVNGDTQDRLGIESGLAGADLDGDGLADLALGSPDQGGTEHLYVLYGDPVRPVAVAASGLPVVESPASGTNEFGRIVRSAGDPSGDGYPDIVVSDIHYNSVGGYVSGQAWVLGGGATRWTGTTPVSSVAVATILGVEVGGYCGSDAAGPGDFSGDGTDDLAIGTPNWNSPYVLSGAVGVFYGGIAGAVPFDEADLLLEGAAGGEYLGSSVAAGDLDGDGLPDLAVAASGAAADAGRVYLVLGGSL